jgi:hypothetical protein
MIYSSFQVTSVYMRVCFHTNATMPACFRMPSAGEFAIYTRVYKHYTCICIYKYLYIICIHICLRVTLVCVQMLASVLNKKHKPQRRHTQTNTHTHRHTQTNTHAICQNIHGAVFEVNFICIYMYIYVCACAYQALEIYPPDIYVCIYMCVCVHTKPLKYVLQLSGVPTLDCVREGPQQPHCVLQYMYVCMHARIYMHMFVPMYACIKP